MAYTPIRDYAIIGNLRSAVLVSKHASVDWAPVPFIDSPSMFAALLDDVEGGSWSVVPEDSRYTTDQHYIPQTNVLVTTFVCNDGSILEVTDFIPIERERTFLPAEEDTTFRMHRRVACTKGAVRATMLCKPKFDYARGVTRPSPVDGGVYFVNKEKRGVLASECPIEIEGDRAVAHLDLTEGEYEFFVFRYNTGNVVFRKDDKAHHDNELAETISFWQKWSSTCELGHCPVEGPWHEAVLRSALMLKILFYEPVGTVAAAATTSLPEAVGGERNWDYRFTWLRDASFTFNAFFRLGHVTEAEEYIRWLIREVYETKKHGPEHLQIMYGLRGEHDLAEEVLTHLDGYQHSKPVRIGNNAYIQNQWDVYGSILDVIWRLHLLRGGNIIEEKHWPLFTGIADHVTKIWNEPDEGLWEVRGGKAHFTYSKVMCWVALDRALSLQAAYGFPGDADCWKREQEKIREAVMTRGWSEKLQSFTQVFDGEHLDASALLFSTVGFIPGNDPKMLSTIRAIQEKLSADNGLLLRYTSDDGLPDREGAFLLASFWLVDALVAAGDVKEAREVFEQVIGKANHVGLFSEEMDPSTGSFLGNFPQAYTHIGLIGSAMLLTETLYPQKKS